MTNTPMIELADDTARDLLDRLVAYYDSDDGSRDDRFEELSEVFTGYKRGSEWTAARCGWELRELLTWSCTPEFLRIPQGTDLVFGYLPSDGCGDQEGGEFRLIVGVRTPEELVLCGSFIEMHDLGEGQPGAAGLLAFFQQAAAEGNEMLARLYRHAEHLTSAQ